MVSILISYVARSAIGAVRVYNILPSAVVQAPTVKRFQRALQHLVTDAAKAGFGDWHHCLSSHQPRLHHYPTRI